MSPQGVSWLVTTSEFRALQTLSQRSREDREFERKFRRPVVRWLTRLSMDRRRKTKRARTARYRQLGLQLHDRHVREVEAERAAAEHPTIVAQIEDAQQQRRVELEEIAARRQERFLADLNARGERFAAIRPVKRGYRINWGRG
jgi:hypothetical protein